MQNFASHMCNYDLMILIHSTLVYKISMSNQSQKYQIYAPSNLGKLPMQDSLQMTLAIQF